MTETSQSFDVSLELAESQLRDIFQLHLPNAPMEAGSLGRMLTHVVNIRKSVTASNQDHMNAAKRLGDFGLTLDRMAKRAAPGQEDVAERMIRLANTLRTAAAELAKTNAVPNEARAAG